MIRLAVLLGTAMTGGGTLTALVRRTIAPRLRLVPGLRARVLDSATPRLHRARGGSAGRRRRFSPLGGTLCPNVLLEDGTRLDDAGAFVVVTRKRLPEDVEDLVEYRGAVLLQASPSGELARWLRRSGAALAVVRPDRTVLAAGRRPATVRATLPAFPGLVPAVPAGPGTAPSPAGSGGSDSTSQAAGRQNS